MSLTFFLPSKTSKDLLFPQSIRWLFTIQREGIDFSSFSHELYFSAPILPDHTDRYLPTSYKNKPICHLERSNGNILYWHRF